MENKRQSCTQTLWMSMVLAAVVIVSLHKDSTIDPKTKRPAVLQLHSVLQSGVSSALYEQYSGAKRDLAKNIVSDSFPEAPFLAIETSSSGRGHLAICRVNRHPSDFEVSPAKLCVFRPLE